MVICPCIAGFRRGAFRMRCGRYDAVFYLLSMYTKDALTRFDAEYYCLLHRGCTGDVLFYVNQCDGAESVLELGCGDGRVTHAVAEVCPNVCGIDHHPDMIERARSFPYGQKTPANHTLEYRQSQILSLDEFARYDVVIMPFTTFFCFSNHEKLKLVQLVYSALKPGGRFIFDTYPADLEDMDSDEGFEPHTQLVYRGQTIDVFERCEINHALDILDVTYRYEDTQSLGTALCQYTVRHYYQGPDDILDTLDTGGFSGVKLFGDFEGRLWPDTVERAIFVATK